MKERIPLIGHDNSYKKDLVFKYSLGDSYYYGLDLDIPYISVHGKDPIVAIDVDGGPMLSVGDEINGMILNSISDTKGIILELKEKIPEIIDIKHNNKLIFKKQNGIYYTYTLVLNPEFADFCRYIFDGDLDNPIVNAIDPSGGPFMQVGHYITDNNLLLYKIDKVGDQFDLIFVKD